MLALIAAGVWLKQPVTAFHGGYMTPSEPFITLTGAGELKPIINSGESLRGFLFEGLPDGIGIAPGRRRSTIDVFVSHEQTTVPFFDSRDFQDASVSKLTIRTKGSFRGAIIKASVALPPSAGFLRFCSAFMAGPDEGLSRYTYFANEEANDIVDVPPGAPYGPDPAVAPQRQAGYAVVLDARSGHFTQVTGMGRLNHENSIVVPQPRSSR